MEMTGRELCVVQLVIALFTEADGECLNPLPGELTHKADHGAAVGAAAQKRPDLLDFGIEEGAPYRLLGVASHLERGGILLPSLLVVDHLPVRPNDELAVVPEEHVARRQSPHRAIRSLWGGHG